MTQQDFNQIVTKMLDHARDTLVKKQAEYNLSDNRFDSFIHGAGITGWTPEQVLLGYWTKHLASIIEIINSKAQFSEELVDEKIGDAINYLLLLRGLLEDQNRIIKQTESETK